MNGFRSVILVSTVLFCFWFFIPFYPLRFSEEIEKILSLSGYGASISLNNPGIFIFSFVCRIAAMLGLFFYARWGVPLMAIWLLFNIVLSPFGGVVVYSGIDTMIGYIATLLDGILLLLAYYNVWQRKK